MPRHKFYISPIDLLGPGMLMVFLIALVHFALALILGARPFRFDTLVVPAIIFILLIWKRRHIQVTEAGILTAAGRSVHWNQMTSARFVYRPILGLVIGT